jgi:hypothetical protein
MSDLPLPKPESMSTARLSGNVNHAGLKLTELIAFQTCFGIEIVWMRRPLEDGQRSRGIDKPLNHSFSNLVGFNCSCGCETWTLVKCVVFLGNIQE